MYRLGLFAIVIATNMVLVCGSTTCNFHQLRRFSNNSLCKKRIYRLLLTFLSANHSMNETEAQAQLYCTQECAGNLIDFLHNQWDCQKQFKESYVKILTSLCSRNDKGKRCIHMLRPSPDDLWNNSSSICSPEHHSHLQGLLGKYECCFDLSFGTRIKSEPEHFCDIQSPPICTPDYELRDDVVPVVAGLTPMDQASDTNSRSDSSSSHSRTTLLLLLLSILSLCCCVMM